MSDQKSEIDRDAVRKILKVLRDNLNEINQGTGTLKDITSHCDVTTSDLGNYPAVTGLATSSDQAYRQISGQYDAFLKSYEGVIEALQDMVGNHEEKEQENAAAANRAMTSGGAAPTTNNTSAY